MDVGRIPRGAIVVALHGDEDGDRPLRWGAQEAALQARPLVVLHVDRSESAAWRAWASPSRQAAQVARSAFGGLEVHDVDVPGSARRTLVEASTRAHLLVLGSRGRGVWRSILQGSVSSCVSAHAVCPVVVLRPGPESAPDAAVVVGVDGSPDADRVAEFGFRHASVHDRPLIVTHLFWDLAAALGRSGVAGSPAEELELLLARAIAGMRERFPDVDVKVDGSHGLLDERLVEEPERHHLLVVGRHPVDSVLRTLTGSRATAVLESAQTAVAVVPHTALEAIQPDHRGVTP